MSRPHLPTSAILGLLLVTACSTTEPSPSAAGSADPGDTPSDGPSATGTAAPTPEPILPDGALLPDLVMEPLADWAIEFDGQQRLLRVSTIFSNYGEGPFEVSGSREGDDPAMRLDQVVYAASGVPRLVPTRVDARYAGDGHNHWHAQQVVTMELANVLDPGTITNGNKINFCFFDDTPTNPGLDDFDEEPHYLYEWCGNPGSSDVTMGLSIGWADVYAWDFVGQYVDITNLPGGTYTLKATVDWANNFYETDDADNCTMARIQIPAAGEGPIVVVEAAELDCST